MHSSRLGGLLLIFNWTALPVKHKIQCNVKSKAVAFFFDKLFFFLVKFEMFYQKNKAFLSGTELSQAKFTHLNICGDVIMPP